MSKWIKITVLFVSIFFLWNYGPFYFTKEEREYRKQEEEERNAREEYIPFVKEIRHAYAKKMKEKFGLVPSGYGGTLRRKVKMLSMDFTVYRRATIEEARALQLIAMDQFVKAINAHDKIRPFLYGKPFLQKRVKIAINFEGPNGQYCDGSVGRILNIDGLAGNKENRNKLFYYAVDPYDNSIVELHSESFDEALKIINASTELNPYEHETTPLEVGIDQVYASFTNEMRKIYHLNCISIGGKMPGMLEEIGANFTLEKHTSQEDARKLLLAMTEKLIETLNSSPELRPYLNEHPFLANRLKIRIGFTKSTGFSYYDGSMVKITLENDKITYFKILPEDRMVQTIPFHEESYQEAQNILRIGNLSKS